jgi:hypothetical protein
MVAIASPELFGGNRDLAYVLDAWKKIQSRASFRVHPRFLFLCSSRQLHQCCAACETPFSP